MAKINANLIAGKISSNSPEAMALLANSRFGEKIGEKVFYSIQETLFLIDEKKLEILDLNNKVIERELLVRKFQKIDKDFKTKYFVFRDLRKKGYTLKTALKFGADFRVYEKGKSIGENHAKWILYVASENETLKWQDFAAKNRVAHSTKKNLLIGVVDEEGSPTYYEISWIKP